MDANDQDDIIKKVKTAGNDDSENSNTNDNNDSTNSGSDDVNGDASSSGNDMGTPNDQNQSGGEEVNEENNLFIEPKKNNMFQPHSNDILKDAVKESVKNLDSSGKSSIFGKIKTKLQETFNQEEEMHEPITEPVVKPAPTTTPSEPKIAPNRKNKPFLPMPDVQPDPKAIKEAINGYEIYHNTLASALEEVDKFIASKGLQSSEKYFPDITVGGIGYGKTARTSKELFKDGKELNKKIQVQIYRMDSGKYELNMYIG